MKASDDQSALALTILGEARGEGTEGMIAVAWTILNRLAKKTWYGNTIKNVCLKSTSSGIHQYSCWNAGDPSFTHLMDLPDDDKSYINAVSIADSVINGDAKDPTLGATHYFRTGIPTPYWAKNKTPCVIIGHHQFYNDIA